MEHGDFKNLAKRTEPDKISIDKAFNVAKNPKYDGYQRVLVSMIYKIFDKMSAGRDAKTHANNERPLDFPTPNLAEE